MNPKITFRIEGSDAFRVFIVKTILTNGLSETFRELVPEEHGKPDFVVSDTIPDGNTPFVVVWKLHNVNEIDTKLLFMGSKKNPNEERNRNLRGFFLEDEIKIDPIPFCETLREFAEEKFHKSNLASKAQDIKKAGTHFKRGSKVVLASGPEQLENLFAKPRFTALFIDKPMLRLMRQLTQILSDIQGSITALTNHYSTEIQKIKNKKGMNKSEFDESLIEVLNKNRINKPLRFEPILLTGGTGVGKTLIARWIHGMDNNKEINRFPGSFQEINASGLSDTLMETELFGYKKGSFTDAKKDKPGLAFLALGGILFLDEIGDIPMTLQPRIMKFIEENTFTPNGWEKPFPIYSPLLVVAATNKDLDKEIKAKRFRADFYARFHHRIHVPSIEDRKESLASIVDLILQNERIHKGKIKYISNEAMDKLRSIRYEENFRGLERIVRSAAAKTIDYGLDIILPDFVEE